MRCVLIGRWRTQGGMKTPDQGVSTLLFYEARDIYCSCIRPTRQVYALLLVEEEDRKLKEAALGGRAEQLELLCRKNAYLQDKV